MEWDSKNDQNFAESSSFCTNSSKASSKISSSSDEGEYIDEEDIDKILMKNFKFVRRNSCCCSFCGKEKITPLRKLKESIVLKEQWLKSAKNEAKQSALNQIQNTSELNGLSSQPKSVVNN